MKWITHRIESTLDNIDIICFHIYPNFGAKHNLIGDYCDCKPKLEWITKISCLVIHNTFGHLSIIKNNSDD